MKKGLLFLILAILFILLVFVSNFFWFTGFATRDAQLSDQNTLSFRLTGIIVTIFLLFLIIYFINKKKQKKL